MSRKKFVCYLSYKILKNEIRDLMFALNSRLCEQANAALKPRTACIRSRLRDH